MVGLDPATVKWQLHSHGLQFGETKVAGVIANAARVLDLQERYGSLAEYLWGQGVSNARGTALTLPASV